MQSMIAPLMASWFLFPRGHLHLHSCPGPNRTPQDPALTLGRRNCLEAGRQEEAREREASPGRRRECSLRSGLVPSYHLFWVFLSSFCQLDCEPSKGKELTWLPCLVLNLPSTGRGTTGTKGNACGRAEGWREGKREERGKRRKKRQGKRKKRK